MINISLIVAAVAAAQYGYTPPPAGTAPTTESSQADSAQGGFDTAPFAQVYGKCFATAESETKAAAAAVKQQKFEACRSQRNAIVKHVTAKLEGSEARQVKRALNRALGDVEESYAKRMGVALPAGGR